MVVFWRTCILVFLGIINVVLFYRMIWGGSGILSFNELRQNYAQLQQQSADLDVQHLQLSREIRLLKSDDAYVEKMIRQRLHYVRDNEVLYLFTNENDTSKQGERDARKN